MPRGDGDGKWREGRETEVTGPKALPAGAKADARGISREAG